MRLSSKPFWIPLAILLSLGACTSSSRILPPELFQSAADVDQDWHRGPNVAVGLTGPARWVPQLSESFDTGRAMKLIRFIDGYYRAPANPYYDEVLDRVAAEMREAGFGEDPRFELRIIEEEAKADAWTPESGEIVLQAPGSKPRRLHGFSSPAEVDRTMLPVNSPSCKVEGVVAMHLNEVTPGAILVTDVSARQVMERAETAGAAAVVSSSLGIYNIDPSGKERHLDAIQFRTVAPGTKLPVFQISPRSYGSIAAAVEQATDPSSVRLQLQSKVRTERRPLRTLVATIVGSSRPDEAVAMVSHIQEPGACDNATGVGGLAESARSLAELLRKGQVDWPARSVCFVWGDEFRQSRAWLDDTERVPIAGFSSDMTGQSKETGAIALLERMPDPGALVTLPPDAHTPWGAGNVEEEELLPNGLAVIARCALVDVGLVEGGWASADHPWEGGSDHDVFIERGIPAVLLWHFTDFTYHTSLDRLPYVDPDEVRRTGVALLGAALAIADPKAPDLDRYLRSLKLEEDVRVAAARDANNEELAVMWQNWCLGAREWLRNQCLGIDEKLPTERK